MCPAKHCATKCERRSHFVTSVWNTLLHDTYLANGSCRELKKDAVPSVAYSDSFGEGGATGTLGYYLASAFEQIYVQQNGLVSFTGMFSCMYPFMFLTEQALMPTKHMVNVLFTAKKSACIHTEGIR